jgi:hypothetical protein
METQNKPQNYEKLAIKELKFIYGNHSSYISSNKMTEEHWVNDLNPLCFGACHKTIHYVSRNPLLVSVYFLQDTPKQVSPSNQSI